jgi:hypothetical protein
MPVFYVKQAKTGRGYLPTPCLSARRRTGSLSFAIPAKTQFSGFAPVAPCVPIRPLRAVAGNNLGNTSGHL